MIDRRDAAAAHFAFEFPEGYLHGDIGTGTRKGYKDAPLEDVVIVSARRVPAA